MLRHSNSKMAPYDREMEINMNWFAAIKHGLQGVVKNYILADPRRAVTYYRRKGVEIGENTELYNTRIDTLRPFLVSIGNNTLITGTTILTHDASTKKGMGYTKLGRITIGDNVFIGINCIILPNVHIGNDVIVGAGTIVSKDIPNNSVAVGNPMQIIGSFEDNMRRNELRLQNSPVFEINYSMTSEEKENMNKLLENRVGYLINRDR